MDNIYKIILLKELSLIQIAAVASKQRNAVLKYCEANILRNKPQKRKLEKYNVKPERWWYSNYYVKKTYWMGCTAQKRQKQKYKGTEVKNSEHQ